VGVKRWRRRTWAEQTRRLLQGKQVPHLKGCGAKEEEKKPS